MGQFLSMLLMFQGNTGVVPGRLLEKLLQVRQAHMELAEVCCLGMLSQNAAVLFLDADLHHRHTGVQSFEKQQEGHSKKGRLAVMRWSPGRETDPRTDCEGLVSHHSSIN